MRQARTGRWWVSAGCLGLFVASAFIGATLYMGGSRAGRPGLAGGPDPAAGPPGPRLVRRKGYLQTSSSPPVTDLPITTELPMTTTEPSTTAGSEDSWQAGSGSGIEVASPPRTSRRPPAHRQRPLFRAPRIDWDEILLNVNRSLNPRVSQRLSELADLDPVALIKNTSSLVSFGLLAVDLFLLHNVQRIAFNGKAAQPLRKDPEVMALNSLFDGGQEERRQRSSGVLGDALGFLQGAVRGVVNLGRAYRRTQRSRTPGPTALDCIWTLYCRTLDKTAKLSGPGGFLAKMNSFGLRLMLGEFSPDVALDKAMTEMSTGWGRLDCDNLFPRCGVEEAKRVVMATARVDG